MSRDNFIADMVKFFEGLHTFTKETQKLDNRMTSHFLKRHGLMSPSSSFRFCYSGCCNSLDILLEHKSKLHFLPSPHAKIIQVNRDHVGEGNKLSSEVVKSIFEVLADWVIELEKGNAEAIKTNLKKGDVALVNVATETSTNHPFFLNLQERVLSGELDIMEVSHVCAYGLFGSSLTTGSLITTTWGGLMSLD